MLNEAIESGDMRPMADVYLRGRAKRWGNEYGLDYAEVYRVERFGGSEVFFQQESLALPGREDEPMHNRPWFEIRKGG